MPPDHAHFNGSVNLNAAESVMRDIAARVPAGLGRIPDGETGDRGKWIVLQLQKFLQLPWRPGRGLRARRRTGLRHDHRRPGPVHRPGTNADPRRAAPVLRRLRPPAFHAVRVAGPAGPGAERGHRGRPPAGDHRGSHPAQQASSCGCSWPAGTGKAAPQRGPSPACFSASARWRRSSGLAGTGLKIEPW